MKKIAAIVTEYRPRSHADVIITKFIHGFPTDDGFHKPRVEVAGLYLDQIPENDIGLDLAEQNNIPVYNSILATLCLGGNELAVDGVLLIGEHGDYAWNEKEQHLYPRRYFMEQICGVMATSGKTVPIFNDKHLSYNWTDAKWMYDRAKSLGAPLMAGSSLPVGWRNPWIEHQLDSPITEAVAIGFSGLDIYGFHTLEVLQCMIERRTGGESGVSAVTCLEGDAVWDAADNGLFSLDLAEAACSTIQNKPEGSMRSHCENPALFLVEYSDKTRGSVLMLNGYVSDLAYAANVNGKVEACEFFLQGHGGEEGAYAHFSYLALNSEEMFLTQEPQYPVERTLLTSGILEAALSARSHGHIRLETPWLENVSYQSYTNFRWRPRQARPTGSCLEPFPPKEKSL
jgi:hypothetical protein